MSELFLTVDRDGTLSTWCIEPELELGRWCGHGPVARLGQMSEDPMVAFAPVIAATEPMLRRAAHSDIAALDQ